MKVKVKNIQTIGFMGMGVIRLEGENGKNLDLYNAPYDIARAIFFCKANVTQKDKRRTASEILKLILPKGIIQDLYISGKTRTGAVKATLKITGRRSRLSVIPSYGVWLSVICESDIYFDDALSQESSSKPLKESIAEPLSNALAQALGGAVPFPMPAAPVEQEKRKERKPTYIG